MFQNLVCTVSHARWAEVVSYSSQGGWRCTKPGCAAQVRHVAQAVARSDAAVKPMVWMLEQPRVRAEHKVPAQRKVPAKRKAAA